MSFTLSTLFISGFVHIMPSLTREQLLNILLETDPGGALRSRVAQWADSTDSEFSDEDFAGRPFTITRR